MPAIFFGHGNPMNALLDNDYTRAWAALGDAIPAPRAVICVSAHWYAPGSAVTIEAAPRTILDFGGFPAELHQVQYPAPGDPALARRVQELLAPVAVPTPTTGTRGGSAATRTPTPSPPTRSKRDTIFGPSRSFSATET